MCGRYYVDDETAKEIEKIIRQVNDKLLAEKNAHDVYPSAVAPVIIKKENQLVAEEYRWGFPNFNKKGVIFNARSETVLEKRMFKESVLHRRCIIPATGFYEWKENEETGSKNKDKYFFRSADRKVLLFAGFYHCYEGEERFVILTTNANDSVKDIHTRMPLILELEEIDTWMFEDHSVESLLHKAPQALEKEIKGQMHLF